MDELAPALAPSLQGVAAQLARWKVWLDTLSPHDALQALYDDGDVLARFAAAAPPAQRPIMVGCCSPPWAPRRRHHYIHLPPTGEAVLGHTEGSRSP